MGSVSINDNQWMGNGCLWDKWMICLSSIRG
jgi:hypothetical protein